MKIWRLGIVSALCTTGWAGVLVNVTANSNAGIANETSTGGTSVYRDVYSGSTVFGSVGAPFDPGIAPVIGAHAIAIGETVGKKGRLRVYSSASSAAKSVADGKPYNAYASALAELTDTVQFPLGYMGLDLDLDVSHAAQPYTSTRLGFFLHLRDPDTSASVYSFFFGSCDSGDPNSLKIIDQVNCETFKKGRGHGYRELVGGKLADTNSDDDPRFFHFRRMKSIDVDKDKKYDLQVRITSESFADNRTTELKDLRLTGTSDAFNTFYLAFTSPYISSSGYLYGGRSADTGGGGGGGDPGTTVPEPATLWLTLGAALVLLGHQHLMRRRRR